MVTEHGTEDCPVLQRRPPCAQRAALRLFMAENRERITKEAPEGGTDQEMAATVYRLWDQLLPRKPSNLMILWNYYNLC